MPLLQKSEMYRAAVLLLKRRHTYRDMIQCYVSSSDTTFRDSVFQCIGELSSRFSAAISSENESAKKSKKKRSNSFERTRRVSRTEDKHKRVRDLYEATVSMLPQLVLLDPQAALAIVLQLKIYVDFDVVEEDASWEKSLVDIFANHESAEMKFLRELVNARLARPHIVRVSKTPKKSKRRSSTTNAMEWFRDVKDGTHELEVMAELIQTAGVVCTSITLSLSHSLHDTRNARKHTHTHT